MISMVSKWTAEAEATRPTPAVAEWYGMASQRYGAKVNKNDPALVFAAAQEGRVDALKWLKEKGVDVNAKGHADVTPMQRAAWGGHVEAMQWLKEQGADVNAGDIGGETPMHCATWGGHVDAMKWLKEQGTGFLIDGLV